MTDRTRIPGSRDVAASRDGPGDADRLVVACPPHPQMGGSRSDARLRAVSEALAEREIACLRIDYGLWDEGSGEQTDVQNALAWAAGESDVVGLFGYSFGAGVGLLAAADCEPAVSPAAVSVLAPPASIVEGNDGDSDVVAAVETVAEGDTPGQVCYAERDGTVDWEAVVDHAAARGWAVEAVAGDHFFAGQHDRVAARVADFLHSTL